MEIKENLKLYGQTLNEGLLVFIDGTIILKRRWSLAKRMVFGILGTDV